MTQEDMGPEPETCVPAVDERSHRGLWELLNELLSCSDLWLEFRVVTSGSSNQGSRRRQTFKL